MLLGRRVLRPLSVLDGAISGSGPKALLGPTWSVHVCLDIERLGPCMASMARFLLVT